MSLARFARPATHSSRSSRRSAVALVLALVAVTAATALLACGSSTAKVAGASTYEEATQRGPYGVGVTTFEVTDTSRPTEANGDFPGAPDRKLVVEVWYPADPSAESPEARDVPVLDSDAPYPLIIFSHGLTSFRRQSTAFTEHLASHGYVVAAPDFPASNNDAPGGPRIAAVIKQPGDVSFLIDKMLEFNQQDGHLLAGSIDEQRIGLTGHSLGALTTFLTTYGPMRDARVRAALPISNVGCFFPEDIARDVSVPILLIVGNNDLLTPPSESERSYTIANAPKYLVRLDGVDHVRFSDVDIQDTQIIAGFRAFVSTETLASDPNAIVDAVGGGDISACAFADEPSGEPVSGDRQRELLRAFATPFFDAYLRGSDGAKRFLEDELPGLVPEAQVKMDTD